MTTCPLWHEGPPIPHGGQPNPGVVQNGPYTIAHLSIHIYVSSTGFGGLPLTPSDSTRVGRNAGGTRPKRVLSVDRATTRRHFPMLYVRKLGGFSALTLFRRNSDPVNYSTRQVQSAY